MRNHNRIRQNDGTIVVRTSLHGKMVEIVCKVRRWCQMEFWPNFGVQVKPVTVDTGSFSYRVCRRVAGQAL